MPVWSQSTKDFCNPGVLHTLHAFFTVVPTGMLLLHSICNADRWLNYILERSVIDDAQLESERT